MKMTLLCHKLTNHVLAALTRAAVPENVAATEEARKAEEVAETAALAGDALVVRYVQSDAKTFDSTPFDIPADQLYSVNVDFDESVLLEPRKWFRDDKGVLHSVAADPDPSTPPPLIVKDTVGHKALEITLPMDLTEEMNVWLQIRREPSQGHKPQTESQTLKPASPPRKSYVIGISQLLAGDYRVLLLAGHYEPWVYELKIP